jgi:nickel-dependent lactate racemase
MIENKKRKMVLDFLKEKIKNRKKLTQKMIKNPIKNKKLEKLLNLLDVPQNY